MDRTLIKIIQKRNDLKSVITILDLRAVSSIAYWQNYIIISDEDTTHYNYIDSEIVISESCDDNASRGLNSLKITGRSVGVFVCEKTGIDYPMSLNPKEAHAEIMKFIEKNKVKQNLDINIKTHLTGAEQEADAVNNLFTHYWNMLRIHDSLLSLPEIMFIRSALKKDINQALYYLSHKEERVIRLKYGIDDGYTRTLQEIANIFNITRSRASQIVQAAEWKLKFLLKDEESFLYKLLTIH